MNLTSPNNKKDKELHKDNSILDHYSIASEGMSVKVVIQKKKSGIKEYIVQYPVFSDATHAFMNEIGTDNI